MDSKVLLVLLLKICGKSGCFLLGLLATETIKTVYEEHTVTDVLGLLALQNIRCLLHYVITKL